MFVSDYNKELIKFIVITLKHFDSEMSFSFHKLFLVPTPKMDEIAIGVSAIRSNFFIIKLHVY